MRSPEHVIGTRVLFLGVVATCAIIGCGGEVAAADNSSALIAVAGTTLTCVQVNPGRPANRQTVSTMLDTNGAPTNVDVWRGPSARLEHSASSSTAVPGYQGGYYEQNYQLLAWNIGSQGENDYFLLLPELGSAVGTFLAQLHLYFNHGASGWWQKVLSCTAQ